MSYRQEIVGGTFYWRALYILLHIHDTAHNSNNSVKQYYRNKFHYNHLDLRIPAEPNVSRMRRLYDVQSINQSV